MVADQRFPASRIGLNGDQVEAHRKRRNHRAIRQRGAVQQRMGGTVQVSALVVIDGFFREPEVPPPSPPDFDDYQAPWGAGVDRDQIDLVAADVHVPAKERPACCDQPIRNQPLGRIAGALRRGSLPTDRTTVHRPIVAEVPSPAIAFDSTVDYLIHPSPSAGR
jgi:hypothetical protein